MVIIILFVVSIFITVATALLALSLAGLNAGQTIDINDKIDSSLLNGVLTGSTVILGFASNKSRRSGEIRIIVSYAGSYDFSS
jgi:hypothetical protein